MAANSVRRHNETLLRELEVGDMVEFPRGPYSHWAVYIGDRRVVHLAGRDDDGLNITSGSIFTICGQRFNKAFVCVDDFLKVADQSKAKKNNKLDRKLSTCQPRSGEEIVEEALKMIGEIGYNILWNNCEHFASFCRYGVEKSEQADKFITWATVGALAAGIAAVVLGKSKSKKKEENQVYM